MHDNMSGPALSKGDIVICKGSKNGNMQTRVLDVSIRGKDAEEKVRLQSSGTAEAA